MAEFATNGKANTGVALGAVGTGLGAINTIGGLANLLGGWGCGQRNGWGAPINGGCAMGTPIVASCDNAMNTRYEMGLESEIARLRSDIALRDANIYNDQKLLEVYKYFDGKIEGINSKLCEQAVFNAAQTSAMNCMGGQIAQLFSLTKLVVPNTSVCPGWGEVTITPTPATAAAGA